MGKGTSFVKGLAAGAVIAAAAALIMEMRDGNGKKTKDLKKAAEDIGKRVAGHAMRIGSLSKSAYGKIVDTSVAEYRGVKALSEEDIKELRTELKEGWMVLKAIAGKRKGKK